MRIHQIMVIIINTADSLLRFQLINPGTEELTLNLLQIIAVNLIMTFGIQTLHIICHTRSIMLCHTVKQALQITGNKNIHRRRNSFKELTASVINTGIYKISQHIIAVGCTQQSVNRQAHQLSIIACQNITEVTCRNNKINRFTGSNLACLHSIYISAEVVNNLRHQTAPVNRIGRREGISLLRQLITERSIAENFLHTALSIIKVTLNTENLNIFACLGNHLLLLDITHTLAGVENDNLRTRNISKTFQSSLASITGGSNQNNNLIRFTGLLHRTCQKMRQKLQCHILKSRRRAMPQLQHTGVIIYLYQRHRIITEFFRRVGSIYTFAQLVLAEISKILQQNINSTLRIRLALHRLYINHTHRRNILRYKQSSIRCQATGYRVCSGKQISFPSCTNI